MLYLLLFIQFPATWYIFLAVYFCFCIGPWFGKISLLGVLPTHWCVWWLCSVCNNWSDRKWKSFWIFGRITDTVDTRRSALSLSFLPQERTCSFLPTTNEQYILYNICLEVLRLSCLLASLCQSLLELFGFVSEGACCCCWKGLGLRGRPALPAMVRWWCNLFCHPKSQFCTWSGSLVVGCLASSFFIVSGFVCSHTSSLTACERRLGYDKKTFCEVV